MAIELVLDGASSVEDQAPVTPAVTTESVLAEVEKLTPEEQNQIEQFSQFFNADYSSQLIIDNIDDYRIENVAQKFIELAK